MPRRQLSDPRVEKVRAVLTDPASRELAEGRGVDVEDVEALLAAYDGAYVTRERVAEVVYKMHGCSCETHDSNGVSAICARWRQTRADQIAATLVPGGGDPEVSS